nr:hypothetical protein BaRGS_033914 [Batillaria attramentaria]
MFGRLVPPEYLSAEMEEKERQEAAKQRHLQGFHEQLAAQRMQAERDARAKAEQRKAAARSQRDEAEEMEEEIQRRREKKVSAKRVAVKGKKEKAKPASPSPKPSSSTEDAEPAEEEEQTVEEADKTESEDETENSEIHPGYAIPPVLRDIPERGQAEQGTDATAKPSYYSAQRTSAQDMGALEESLREQLEPAVVRRGHDSVTVRMFERRTPGDDRVSVALLPRSSVRDSKTALVQRLQAMNDQMAAMDEMSHNIESGLHNSKLLLDTLHSMNEVNQSVPDVSLQVPDVGRAIGRHVDTKSFCSGEVSHVSGVSGISDIIGEVLADGGVDLTAAGLTKEEADMLAARARYKRGPHSPRTSADELKQMVQAAEGAKSPEMKRREIHKWMTEKYAERQQEYLKNLSTLKEREHSPYKPSAPVTTQITIQITTEVIVKITTAAREG